MSVPDEILARHRQLVAEAKGKLAAQPPQPPDCIYLGPAVPNQPGVPCGQRVRECSEFGVCTVHEPCAEAKAEGKVQHWCIGTDGKRCPEYVAKDT